MKREYFDFKSATKVIAKTLRLTQPSDRANNVRIPVEVFDNDMFFGA